MIIRLLLIALLVWAFFLILKQVNRRTRHRTTKQREAGNAASMVRCTQCGLHIPSSEAIYRDQLPFCCPEHASHPDG